MSRNPLWTWAAQRLQRDPRTLAGFFTFALLFYGMVGLTVLSWAGSAASGMCTVLHYEAWSMNMLVLLVYAPARLAQSLARERERGTLDMLSLTGLSGRELALGQAGVAALLPLVMVASTAPVVLLGLLGKGGFEAVLRGYVGLAVCAPAYLFAAGIAGLSVKKAQSAGGVAIFVVGGALASGLFLGPWRDLKPLSLLGPWGPGLATVQDELNLLFVFGHPVPGELLQVPLLFALGKALLTGLGRRIGGEPAVLLGRRGALTLGVGVALIAFVTFSPQVTSSVWSWRLDPGEAEDQLFARYLLLWGALLLLAVETPVGWRDLVRGLGRRDPDDAAFAHERLRTVTFSMGPALIVGFSVLASWGLWVNPQLSAGALLGCAAVASASWLVAALTFQAAHLLTKDQGLPRLFAILALLVVWCGPLVASVVLTELGVGGPVLAVTRMPNPIYAMYSAAHHVDLARRGAALDPLSVAIGSTVLQLLIAAGLWRLVQLGAQRAEERARELVALPADAYAAPGTLTQRCPQGHLFTAAWQRCPHCEAGGDPTQPVTRPPASP